MDTKETISFKWDAQNKVGTVRLLLMIDILKRYCVPQSLDAYNKGIDGHDIGVLVYTFNDLKSFKAVKDEIGEFIATLSAAKIIEEDPYHASHLLCLLVDHTQQIRNELSRNDFKALVLERVLFLRKLITMDSPISSSLKFETSSSVISYKTGSDNLTKGLFYYVTTQLKKQVKRFDMRLYKLLVSGANEITLKEAMQLTTEHRIDIALIAKLAKKILYYLNNETSALRNNQPKSLTSVTVKQGNLIYQILKGFHIYQPIKRANRTEDDEYDDAIRKLILRADITDDK